MSPRLLLRAGIAGALILGIAAGTLAASARKRASPGAPPPQLTSWIVLTKPAHNKGLPGFQILAAPDGTVTAANNPLTGANGSLRLRHIPDPPDRRFGCPCVHFHGTVGARRRAFKDPDPNHCGWGCVEPYEEVSDAVAGVSDAVMWEWSAIVSIRSNNLAGALEELSNALDALADAMGSVPEVGDNGWTQRDADKFQEDLEDAAVSDTEATATIRSAQKDPIGSNRRKKKLERALAQIDEAFKKKQKAMIRVGKWELR